MLTSANGLSVRGHGPRFSLSFKGFSLRAPTSQNSTSRLPPVTLWCKRTKELGERGSPATPSFDAVASSWGRSETPERVSEADWRLTQPNGQGYSHTGNLQVHQIPKADFRGTVGQDLQKMPSFFSSGCECCICESKGLDQRTNQGRLPR